MKNYAIEIKWGVLISLLSILWMFMEKMVGLHSTHIDKHAIYTNFIDIPIIIFYVFALLEKRKKHYGGFMTFKQGFVAGLIVTLVGTLLSPIAQYITSTFISPDYFANVSNYAVQQGKMSKADAEAYFNLKSYIIQGLIGIPIIGIIISAVVTVFVRRRKGVV